MNPVQKTEAMIGETELGCRIGEMCGSGKFSEFWLSWDAFGKLNKTTRKSITEMIGAAMPKGLLAVLTVANARMMALFF